MQALRDGLWPPCYPSHILEASSHEVSLVDDEKSFAAGLLGAYGRLVKTSGDTMSLVHPHWGGAQLRWRLVDIQEVRLQRKSGQEVTSAGVFGLVLRSENGQTRILHFYSLTAVEAIGWIRAFVNEKSAEAKQPEIKVENFDMNGDVQAHAMAPDYAVIRKDLKVEESELKPETSTPEDRKFEESLYGKIEQKSKGLAYMEEVSGGFLDASMSSLRQSRTDTEDSSSSTEGETSTNLPWENDSANTTSEDVYEHVYEDLSSRRETIYEEIDLPENEYVPPLPPTLPKRPVSFHPQKLNTLRLQVLSESIAEALKQAEKPIVPLEDRFSVIGKVEGKCRSHQPSPTREMAQTGAMKENVKVEKRRFSEPDANEVSLYANVLPLLPFDGQAAKDPSTKALHHKMKKKESKHSSLADLLHALQIGDNLPLQRKGAVKKAVNNSAFSCLDEKNKLQTLKDPQMRNGSSAPSKITKDLPEPTEEQYFNMK